MSAAYAIDGRRVARDAFYAAACDPARSVVVEACAGAGKTWMLVSRVVRALLAGTPPQQILAITFTRKAAGEMRQRLDQWLAEFAAADIATRCAALRERGLDAAQAAALAPRLGALQQELLDGGRMVEIGTFHAWFARLLRAAPIDLLGSIGLDAGRELIEDPLQLASELYRRFHAALLDDAALRDDYRALVHEHGRAQVRKWLDAAWARRIEVELADRAGTLEPSVAAASPGGADRAAPADGIDRAASAHGIDRATSADSVGSAASGHGIDRAASAGADPARRVRAAAPLFAAVGEALAAQRGHARKRGQRLLAALALPDHRAALDGVRTTLLDERGAPRGYLAAPRLDDALAALREIDTALAQHDGHVAHRRMVRLSRALLAAYAALKRERGIADMADLEQVALALLRDSALAGWVQQRLDARVRQLLIDEFQDTSPLQWQALSAWLSAYAGAGGGGAAPGLFIVGDPKQSIYRFRGAEPRVFAAARDFVRDAFDGALLECDHTRRNAPGVIDAVNRVFTAARDQQGFAGFRAHSTEVAGDAAEPLAVALPSQPRTARARAAPRPAVWRDSLSVPRVEADEPQRRFEARQVAAGIAALVDEGIAPGEILVLARKHESLRHIEAELQGRGLPYAAADEVALAELPEVRDLVALLDALASPRHDLSLARALKSALFGAGDDDLLRLARAAAGIGWWRALMNDRSTAFERARTLLARWADTAVRLPPHDLLDMIVHEADFVARVAARVPAARRSSALASIDALLALALELDGARYPSIYGFVRALQRRALKTMLARPRDAVRLLTVHGAKGLEAAAVFLIDADAEARNAETMTLLVDWPVDAAAPRRCAFVAAEARCPRSLAALLETEVAAREREALNALYVAMTRAQRRLIVSRTVPQRASALSWWQLLEPQLAPWSPGAVAPDASRTAIELPELPRWQGEIAATLPSGADERASRIGSALHRVLEWAGGPARNGASLASLARAAAAQWLLDAAGAADVERHAAAILGSATCRRFFDAREYAWAGNEVPLAAPDGAALRADRIVVFEHGEGRRCFWLLDFKLNPAPQAQPENIEQMRRYRDVLRALQPHDEVRCGFISAGGELIEPELPG